MYLCSKSNNIVRHKFMEKKKAKAEYKKKRWAQTLEKLRNTPPERLSKYARWILENEKDKPNIWYDMKAVMK